ncbi:MAG: hypothetical protein H6R15_410 [Proteobacteria bacterium]|nr:hypothetical protein [Pseudomonadota bacterium]
MNIAGLSSAASFYVPSVAARSTASAAADKSAPAGGKATQSGQLSADEEAEVRKLKARDREVRQHEQAHLAAAGGLATSGASFSYQKGPDGVNYAVGGEVNIDTSAGNTPQETLQRAQRIRAAAMAPADPSAQDQAVAAQAGQMAQQASAEIAQQRQTQANPSGAAGSSGASNAKIERYYGAATAANAGGALSIYA